MISRKTPAILTLLLSIFGISYLAGANMGTNDSRLIQYTGRLEIGTQPAQGLYDFRFALFTSAASDISLDCLLAEPANCALWTEEHLGSIDVQAGTFSVQLGENTNITDTILGQNELWLGVAVRATGESAYSKLSGSQRIVASPLASRAASAKDFKITGAATMASLTVANNADVLQHLGVGLDLDVDRDLQVLGTSSTAGDAAVRGSLHVGSSTPGPWADGYLVVNQAAQFRCNSCGSGSAFEGSGNYGTLNIQGRVFSASDNIHLSPPGGKNVYLESGYRSAGGTSSGVVGLVVQGDITSGCPTGMLKIGSTCIQSSPRARGVDTWMAAGDRCRGAGLRMCTMSEVSYTVRSGHLSSQANFYVLDWWVWVDSGRDGAGACHTNLNTNQPGSPAGTFNCGINAFNTHPSVGTICCK